VRVTGMPGFAGLEVYENINPKIIELYNGERLVLDIGCGSGALGARIKQINPDAVVHGIDISPEAGIVAGKRLDRFVCLDLDREALPDFGAAYDLIILGDLLEHLKRPDTFLAELRSRLRNDGHIILSVPNIANYSIRLRLLLGEFSYTETGILDRTHVRFFTYRTITEMMEECGFRIEERRFISRFPDWLARFLFRLVAVQFIFRLEKK
jgi:2-polyprenyl-3-methyl-5-hydroxy-6-metoxy-1,4-benzoquinol methylase